jgi:hypothetical protein
MPSTPFLLDNPENYGILKERAIQLCPVGHQHDVFKINWEHAVFDTRWYSTILR